MIIMTATVIMIITKMKSMMNMVIMIIIIFPRIITRMKTMKNIITIIILLLITTMKGILFIMVIMINIVVMIIKVIMIIIVIMISSRIKTWIKTIINDKNDYHYHPLAKMKIRMNMVIMIFIDEYVYRNYHGHHDL